jgi:hypothetical protein
MSFSPDVGDVAVITAIVAAAGARAYLVLKFFRLAFTCAREQCVFVSDDIVQLNGVGY